MADRDSSYIRSSTGAEFSEKYDYAFVFALEGEAGNRRQSDMCKYMVKTLLEAKFDVFSYLSVQEDELIVLLKADFERLKRFADFINFQVELDPTNLERVLKEGYRDPSTGKLVIAPININHDPTITPMSPYQSIFGHYEYEDEFAPLYITDPNRGGPFSNINILKLTYYYLEAPKVHGGCEFELSKYLKNKKMLGCFPLHDRTITKQLLDKVWETGTKPWDIPFFDYKEYFGEKIALFNVFMGHYSLWLLIPSFIGLALQLVVLGTFNLRSPVLPFYSVIITVWGIVMLEYWKRENAKISLYWGTTEFEESELERSEYVGEQIKSFIDGSDMIYFAPHEFRRRLLSSRVVIFMLVFILLGVVTGIYVIRFVLAQSIGSNASLVASFMFTVQITLFNIMYQSIAVFVTNQENQRTDTEYEDSLIVKLFIFQFINSYASFFFLAFMAPWLPVPANTPSSYVGECGAPSCMEPLAINLAIIYGTRLTLTNFLDIYLPYLSYKWKLRRETAGVDSSKDFTPPEKDYILMEYNTVIESIEKYADCAIQYGYSMLFITALPCATFFCLISNYVKVKFNAWKLITFYQRPVPDTAQDIGTWQPIFSIITVAAVITNAGIVCFTMDVMKGFSSYGTLWVFIGYQWVLFAIQYIASVVIKDESNRITIQKKRMKFITSKAIERTPDEDDVITGSSANQREVFIEYERVESINETWFNFFNSNHHLIKKIDFTRLPEVNVSNYVNNNTPTENPVANENKK